MKIYFNNDLIDLPNDHMTLSDFLNWKEVKLAGTAVAVNNKIIRKNNWDTTPLSPLDNVTVITAAFGG